MHYPVFLDLRSRPVLVVGGGKVAFAKVHSLLEAGAPVTVVAPARESAIVLVSAWGVLRLRERQGLALKLGGALAILAGVVLLVI